MQKQTFKPRSNHFDNLFTYLKNLRVEHVNLPVALINKELFSILEDSIDTSFEIEMSKQDESIFKTTLVLNLKFGIHLAQRDTLEKTTKDIYNIYMTVESFTRIQDAYLTGLEVKEILMVDVPYLIFPYVQNQVDSIVESIKSTPIQLHVPDFDNIFKHSTGD